MTEKPDSSSRASTLSFGAPRRRPAETQGSPLQRLAAASSDMHRRARRVLTVTPANSQRSFDVSLLGVLSVRRCLLISAPATADGSLIAISRDSTLACRWFNPMASFEFTATVANLLFEPVPIIVLAELRKIVRQQLRGQARALTSMGGSLRAPDPLPALIVDLSLGGARIATTTNLALPEGARLELSLRPRLIDKEMLLSLTGTLAHKLGQCDADHPDIWFYGVHFEGLDEYSTLVLQSLIQERLVAELDFVSALLENGVQR